ncbi:hypothetical protein C8N37_10688 [Sphingobacterium faecium]|nr:hypothetical protein C8N37_10688 [Sphingobacterium faecium]
MTSLGDLHTKDTPRIHEKHQASSQVVQLLCERYFFLCENLDLLCKRQKINQKKAGIIPAKENKLCLRTKERYCRMTCYRCGTSRPVSIFRRLEG